MLCIDSLARESRFDDADDGVEVAEDELSNGKPGKCHG
jgi:hypothetical protein